MAAAVDHGRRSVPVLIPLSPYSSDRLRQFQRGYRSALRGAGIGLLLRGGLHSVSAVTRISRGKSPGRVAERALDSARWACALGCFGAVYVSVDETVRTVLGCNRTAHFRAALAGAAAGPSILLTGFSRRHDELALYVLLRGLTLLIRIGNKTEPTPRPPETVSECSSPVAPSTPPPFPPPADSPSHSPWHQDAVPARHPHHLLSPDIQPPSCGHGGADPSQSPFPPSHQAATAPAAQPSRHGRCRALLRQLLAPTRWLHGDVVLMAVASWHIVISYVLFPSSLPQSFIHFMNKMIGDKWLIPIVREFALLGSGRRPAGAPLPGLQGTPFEGRTGITFCDVLHPTCTGAGACDRHVLSVLPAAFWRALAVYAPVYAASTAAVQRSAVFRQPAALLARMLAGAARSALFLTLYVGLAHRGVCLVNTWGRRKGLSIPAVFAMAWLPGLAIVVEKKSRRMELALYCTCRALLSLSNQALQRKTVPRSVARARTDIMMFSAACACLMHCYSGNYGAHRDIFRSKYVNVLDFVFGSRGMHAGLIAHAQSNRSLLRKYAATTTATMRSISAPNLARFQ